MNITQKFPNSQKDNYQKTDKPSKNIYRNKIFYQVQNVSISSLLVVKTRFVEWTKDQLSTITSLFAMLVILRVFFKYPIDKIISLINLRIDKLIGKNRKVQQADLNKSVENHEKTNDK